MAAAAAAVSPLEELVSCPVCFEIYYNPQSLSCLHVLCVNCTQQLVKHNYVECPECRRDTRYDDIKNDFNKQTLVDLYLKQKDVREVGEGLQSLQSVDAKVESVCESCKKSRPVKWKCDECSKYMCEDCHVAHNSFAVTATHNVKSIEDVTKEISSDIERTLDLLKDEQTILKEKSHAEGKFLQDLEAIKVKTAHDINAHREALKKSIDEQHDEEMARLEVKITCAVNVVIARKQTMDKHILGIDSQISLLTDLRTTNDMATLISHSEEVKNNVKQQVECMAVEVNELEDTSLPVVEVIAPSQWDHHRGTKLKFIEETPNHQDVRPKSKVQIVDETPIHQGVRPKVKPMMSKFRHVGQTMHGYFTPPGNRDVKSAGYHKTLSTNLSNMNIAQETNQQQSASQVNTLQPVSHLNIQASSQQQLSSQLNIQASSKQQVGFPLLVTDSRSAFKTVRSVDLPFSPTRMQWVDNSLFCTGDNKLHVYSWECELIRSVKLNTYHAVRAVIEDHEHRLIAACPDENGLHLLNATGTYLCLLSPGSFSDVVLYQKNVYALDCAQGLVHVFEYRQQQGWFKKRYKWLLKKLIPLNELGTPAGLDTLDVSKGMIYVCTNDCRIFKVSTTGEVKTKFGKLGEGNPGRLRFPHLCNTDGFGNILVVDERNNNLQICSRGGKWTEVNIPGLVRYPRDAVADNQGNNIWVCSDDRKLVQYYSSPVAS